MYELHYLGGEGVFGHLIRDGIARKFKYTMKKVLILLSKEYFSKYFQNLFRTKKNFSFVVRENKESFAPIYEEKQTYQQLSFIDKQFVL